MRLNKTSYLVGISSLCFLLILGFQIYWLNQSRNLIEDQFNQKVSMALCMAVGSLEGCDHESCTLKSETMTNIADESISITSSCLQQGIINHADLCEAIEGALVFYDLPQEFEVEILTRRDADCDPASPYCCALVPYNAENEHFLLVRFPERRAYVFAKMWLMLVSCVLILLLVLIVFVLSLRALLMQQKISRFNVDFFNNMAHEFRTPLANIHLALRRIGKKEPNAANQPYLQIIRGESIKLNENVERVLSLARIKDGHYELRKEKINVKELLHAVLGELTPMIKKKGAQIEIAPDLDRFRVWADPLHMSHAFKNLIENSLKYCDTLPEIDISYSLQDKGIVLIFRDNGIGIDAKNKEMVFNRFTRIETVDNIRGFGLGLSYIKMIVDLHKGKINLFSQAGQGSRFELFFPQLSV